MRKVFSSLLLSVVLVAVMLPLGAATAQEEPQRGGRLNLVAANVFTDLDQIAATLVALAGLWFVTMFNAWQMIRQRLTTGTTAQCGLVVFARGGVDLFDLCIDGSDIGQHRLIKQAGVVRMAAVIRSSCQTECGVNAPVPGLTPGF